METTFWNLETVERARPLLSRIAQDLDDTYAQLAAASAGATEARAALEKARPQDAGPRWHQVADTDFEIDVALLTLVRLHDEVRSLNGTVDDSTGAIVLRLTGSDAESRPTVFTFDGATGEARAEASSAVA